MKNSYNLSVGRSDSIVYEWKHSTQRDMMHYYQFECFSPKCFFPLRSSCMSVLSEREKLKIEPCFLFLTARKDRFWLLQQLFREYNIYWLKNLITIEHNREMTQSKCNKTSKWTANMKNGSIYCSKHYTHETWTVSWIGKRQLFEFLQ